MNTYEIFLGEQGSVDCALGLASKRHDEEPVQYGVESPPWKILDLYLLHSLPIPDSVAKFILTSGREYEV